MFSIEEEVHAKMKNITTDRTEIEKVNDMPQKGLVVLGGIVNYLTKVEDKPP
ncbi:MAG: hypothetical protein U9N43_01155 [Euryarchaeota archaeon]|nr:hypothetical protein [Euryarchaeota archaeon]